MLPKILVILLSVVQTILAMDDQAMCPKNRSLFEIPGDAVLSVFLNINHGPYCNVTSNTGLEEAFTASYVVHLLNKYEPISGLLLGK
ncbi:unnamed protein product [Heterotrigona itama]|uniref:Uncharacterized protein n=1 Tax=Heterotrigona itama TaxID=395501 RepID=A0A6V7HJL0_9HYME|nr:unnamed protein product [Heterotrigona itama]